MSSATATAASPGRLPVAERAPASEPLSITERSRQSLLGLLALPRQQHAAALRATGDEEEERDFSLSFFALCYADAGVSESLRSLGIDTEVLARDASVALLCDLEKEGAEKTKAVSTAAAALWRGRCGFQACDRPGHLFLLLSSSSSLGAAAEVLRAHASWAIAGGGVGSGVDDGGDERTKKSKTTILVSPSLASGPRALSALAASLEDAAGLRRRSLSGGGAGGGGGGGGSSASSTPLLLQPLRGCEWSLAGARPSWFVLPERGEAGELSKAAWPLVPEEEEEEQGSGSPSSSSKSAAVAAAAAFSTAAALAAGAASQAGLKLDPFVVGDSPAARAVAEALVAARRGEPDALPSSSLLARAAKAAAAAAASALSAASSAAGGDLRRAALVLIDSRAFVAGAALHDDHPLSRALCCDDAGKGSETGRLPRRRRGGDVEVSLFNASSSSSFSPPSSLIDAADPWIDSLACRRPADAALLLRKWLREAARAAGVPVPARGRAGSAPPAELRALVDALAAGGLVKARVSGAGRRARALAGAYAEAAIGVGGRRWEAAAEAERRLLLGLASEQEGGAGAGDDESSSSSSAAAAAAAAVSAVAEELAGAFRRCCEGGDESTEIGTGAALADALLLAAVGASVVSDLKSSSSAASTSTSSASFSSLFGEENALRIRGEALRATLTAYKAAVKASKEVKRELASEVGWRPAREKKAAGGGEGESESGPPGPSPLEGQVSNFLDSFFDAAARAAGARAWLPRTLRLTTGGKKTVSCSPVAEIVSRILRREAVPGVGGGSEKAAVAPASASGVVVDDSDDVEGDGDASSDDDGTGPSLRSLLRGALAGAGAAAASGFSTPPPKTTTTKTKGAAAAAAAAAATRRLKISDYDDVVLFFVGGGLAPADARAVVAAVAAEAATGGGGGGGEGGRNDKPPPRVLLGGSGLVGPGGVYRGLVDGAGARRVG